MTSNCGEVNVLEGSAAIQGDLDRNRPTGALTRTNDESFPERQSPAAIQRPGRALQPCRALQPYRGQGSALGDSKLHQGQPCAPRQQ